MRNVKYDYEFYKPDKTYLSYSCHTMQEVINTVTALTKTYYDLDYPFSRNTVYNIMSRPGVAHQFYVNKLKIRKHAS